MSGFTFAAPNTSARRFAIIQYRRDQRHVYRHIAGEHLLISLHRDAVAPLFAFTPTGAALWDAIEEWATEQQLVERLTSRYDVDHDQAETDVREFVNQLLAIGAVEKREVNQ